VSVRAQYPQSKFVRDRCSGAPVSAPTNPTRIEIGSAAAAFWTALWPAFDAHNADALRRSARDLKLVRYYVGKDDQLVYATVAPTVAMLRKNGIKLDLTEITGGHIWINWRRYLLDFAPYLFR
jgi:enterochelin esterase-like enzyme